MFGNAFCGSNPVGREIKHIVLAFPPGEFVHHISIPFAAGTFREQRVEEGKVTVSLRAIVPCHSGCSGMDQYCLLIGLDPQA